MIRGACFFSRIWLVIFLFAGLAAGCGKSAPTRYYTLESAPGAAALAASGACFSLGVGPVELPAYLDRTHIVTRGEANRMQLSEFELWVEPLGDNFKRILMDDLAAHGCGKPVVLFPWAAGAHPDLQITVQVQRFDAALGGSASLAANWTIQNPDGKVLVWKSSTLDEPISGAGFADMAGAQSRLVAALAREILAAIDDIGVKAGKK